MKQNLKLLVKMILIFMKTKPYHTCIKRQLMFCFLILFAINSTSAQFEEQTNIQLPKLKNTSVAWGDFNNDGFLDLLLTGDPGDHKFFPKLFKNNGDGTFTEQPAISLTGVRNGSVTCGDYNNDGRLDILFMGDNVSKVYKNNGDGTFTEQTGISFTGGNKGSVAWGDYNNDGWLDILLTGDSVSKIYKNNKDGTFSEQSDIKLTGVQYGSAAWGDYNNDGFSDILLRGQVISNNYNYKPVAKIYQNNGNGTFSEQKNISLTGISSASACWGDYNNDGLPDITLAGYTDTSSSHGALIMYKNNGDGTFSQQTEISYINGLSSIASGDYNNDGLSDILLTSTALDTFHIYKNQGNGIFEREIGNLMNHFSDQNSAIWIDYNNDGKLDVMSFGNASGFSFSDKIFKNTGSFPSNTSPSAPTNLGNSTSFNSVFLRWDKSTDLQTPQNGLSYNIRMGTMPAGSDIVNPMADINSGFRRKPDIGNAGQKNDGYLIRDLPAGTYYWSVQAIDNAFAGGIWATESTFTITSIQVSGLVADSIGLEGIKLRWINGNSDKRIVFIAEGNKNVVATPLNNMTYSASDSFGLGTEIDTSGWYCVYNGTGNEMVVTDMKENTSYSIVVFEYTGSAGNEIYNTGTFKGNLALVKTRSIFEEQTSIQLADLKKSGAVWGDYNNDGFLDILIYGENSLGIPVSIIYKNNGNETFTEQTGIHILGVTNAYLSWGDYNNDGWMDILLSGDTCTTSPDYPISKIYKNNGDGTFTEQNGIKLNGATLCSAVWGDFNNDGWIDIAMSGNTGNSFISKIYWNKGDETFNKQTEIDLIEANSYLSSGRNSKIIGDFNNDGFVDIQLYTMDMINTKIKNLKNNGDGTFSEQPVYQYEGLIGDYNNDGFMDKMIGSKLYKNNGDGTFSEETGVTLPGGGSWADYNNDGYMDVLIGTKIYKNVGNYPANSIPDAPANPAQTVKFNNVTLKWNKANDAQTSPNELNYNIRVGTTPGSSNVVSPMSSTSDGYRRKPTFGNAGKVNDTLTLCLPAGKYYWSVQSIDNSYAGSSWSPESTFTITSTQASKLSADSVSLSEMKLSWTNGSGNRRVVFITEDNKTDAIPADSATYFDNSNYSSGSQIDTTGWYCVYNGTNNGVSVTGLKEGTSYKIAVFEYSGISGNEKYNTSIGVGNIALVKTKQLFELQTGISFTQTSVSDWGDYNNDGLLDAIGGSYDYRDDSYRGKIHKNNGDGTFTEQAGSFYGPATWGDFNNDNNLDLILSVHGKQYGATVLCKNNGDGTFSNQLSLSDELYRNPMLGDYNNDGLQDILITGAGPSKIYKNNGDGTFTEQTSISSLSGGYEGIWGDYNNDGFMDILIRGNEKTLIYKNNGNGTFSEQTDILLPRVSTGFVAWGDYNNDGFLDILMAGLPGYPDPAIPVLKIYKNNGDGTFSEQPGVLPQAVNSSWGSGAWGDYNNDGFLDIILIHGIGYVDGSDNTCELMIYTNNGDGTFTEHPLPRLIVYSPKVKWVDYDNDGYLDYQAGNKVFRNNGAYVPFPKNTLPSAPTKLQQIINSNSVILRWDKARDAQTPQDGISYNVRIGTSPGAVDIVSPMAFTNNGFRKIPSLGNTGQKNAYILNNIPNGTYYWSVQAIDNSYVGGSWAPEQSFSLPWVGIKDIKTNGSVKFYPNPATENITIISDNGESGLVTISNLTGKNVLSQQITSNEQIIHLSNLGKGLYIIKLQTNNSVLVSKLIIK